MTFSLSPLEIIFCFGVGLVVGTIYFGGLWLTIQQLRTAISPVKTLFISWLFRNAIMCVSLFLIMQGQWQRLLVAFIGMMSVKVLMTTLTKRKLKQEKVKV